MITRTIKYYEVTALTFNTKTESVSKMSFVLTGKLSPRNTIQNLSNMVDSCTEVVKILEVNENTKLFGMSDDDFIQHSVELDAKTRKEIKEDKE